MVEMSSLIEREAGRLRFSDPRGFDSRTGCYGQGVLSLEVVLDERSNCCMEEYREDGCAFYARAAPDTRATARQRDG